MTKPKKALTTEEFKTKLSLLGKIANQHKQAKVRINTPTDNVAVQQAKSYFSKLGKVSGKLLWLFSFKLLMALLMGFYVGMDTFFQEMSRKEP